MKKKLAILFPLIFIFGALLGMMDFTIENARAGTPKSGIISVDETWPLAGSPYWIEGNVTIAEGVTLIIEPGVEVRFNGKYRIIIEGNMSAIGDESNLITLTSNKSSPMHTDWHSIYVNTTGHITLNYAIIKYGTYGIYLYSSKANLIRNSTISFTAIGINLYNSTNNIIWNVTVNSTCTGMELRYSSNNTIAYSDTSFNQIGIGLYNGSSYNTIIGLNTSNNTGVVLGDGIIFFSSHHNYILDSTAIGDKVGIIFYNASHNHISNFTASLNINGIQISATSSSNQITDSTLDQNYDGISISSSPKNLIENTTIVGNTDDGIHIYNSSNLIITNSNITTNNRGIDVWASSSNHILNSIIKENNYGIVLNASLLNIPPNLNNTIMENNISSNLMYGIKVNNSYNNSIYHNNIANNVIQAQDDTSNGNYWDNGYPSGGNFWSDWSSPDTMKGLNQEISGSDGIVDSPYVIDSDSEDQYPLASPYNPGPPPSAPTILNAQLNGLNGENVTLIWALSGDDGAGEDDVFGYVVYFGSEYNPDKEGYELLDFVSNGTDFYIHENGGEGNPNSHFYYIEAWALDRIGNSSSDQAGKFSRALQPGKHLVSIPLVQSDESVELVLKTLRFDVAWYYNNTDIIDPWKSYNPSKPFNDLERIDHTMGLWVNVIESSNLTVAGIVPKLTNITLAEGWNLVGYPSFKERPVSEAFETVSCERIEGFSLLPPQYLKILSGAEPLNPGYGYWVKVSSTSTWSVYN